MTTELPDRLSCDECKEAGKGRIHFAYSQYVDEAPDGPWTFDILNHDGTSRFQWPYDFETKTKAEAFIQNILDEALASLGETVV